jgi:hypothetical protein
MAAAELVGFRGERFRGFGDLPCPKKNSPNETSRV